MAVRVKRFSKTAAILKDPIYEDATQTQRETTVDGYTFHWAPGQVRNFLDDGVGAAHAAFAPGTNVVENIIPFGSSRA